MIRKNKNDLGNKLIAKIKEGTFLLSSFFRYGNFSNLNSLAKKVIEIRSFSEEVFLSNDFPIHAKRKILDMIQKYCMEIEDILKNGIKKVSNPLVIELLLDFVQVVYLSGCEKIFYSLFEEFMDSAKGYLDLQAHFADVLMESGCIDLAHKVLHLLYEKNYNPEAVSINLAITSYMLGYPRESLVFLKSYEKITGQKSKLMVSIKIALSEV